MPRVNLDKPAPDFSLENFEGVPVQLSANKGKANILLVFNRGFM